jgi:septum formation protein
MPDSTAAPKTHPPNAVGPARRPTESADAQRGEAERRPEPERERGASANARHDWPIVLASVSPRRHALLARAGVAFEARPADLNETPRKGETAEETLARLARAKAATVAAALDPGRLVLGADTGVVLGTELFGKPRDPEHAIAMLARLAGHTHRVITEVALAESGSRRVWQCSVTTHVTMRAATLAELARYVAGGEPLDKAGAYAYQGDGGAFVSRVEGSESNVIGLPLEETLALIACARAALA